ncbi:hypothetical protein M446_3979 [Methylobacterium sp. 4-46]|nr:hypothetical protein M446_3979 [Methylobacterium sp. 4-46]
MRRRSKTGNLLLGAARVRAENKGAPCPLTDRYEAEARTPLPPDTPRAAGGELLPGDDFTGKTFPAILDTLADPTAVSADASRDRLDLAQQAGSLEMALDTADSIQAADALERMLAHQLATAHVAAMKAAALMRQHLDVADQTRGAAQQAAGIEAARMAGAFTRLTGSFQAGMATLQRMRSGGRQVVVVQHNHINKGAQAVVTGTVAPGGSAHVKGRGQG